MSSWGEIVNVAATGVWVALLIVCTIDYTKKPNGTDFVLILLSCIMLTVAVYTVIN